MYIYNNKSNIPIFVKIIFDNDLLLHVGSMEEELNKLLDDQISDNDDKINDDNSIRTKLVKNVMVFLSNRFVGDQSSILLRFKTF